MQPLSAIRRRTYLAIFVVLFLVCIPVAIFFASGYRFTTAGFVRTGGVFLSVPYSNASVYMDGELVGTSGILRRSFYLDSLVQGTYEIRVEREGWKTWNRTLVVEPEVVTDANAFLISDEVAAIPIIIGTTTATTTRSVTRALFNSYIEAFDSDAATSTPRDGDEAVFVENGDVFVRLTDDEALPTSNFCVRPSACAREVSIETGSQLATNAFYIGELILFTTREGGVFISEVDVRPTPLVMPLFAGRSVEARLIEGQLIINDGGDLYGLENL